MTWSALRLIAGALLAALIVVGGGQQLAEAFLPVLEWSYGVLDDSVTIRSLHIDTSGAVSGHDRVFSLVVSPAKGVYINGRYVFANSAGEARISVLIAYLWQALTVALPFALAWPAAQRREWLARALLLPPVLLVLALFDLPFVLWAQVWQLYVNAYEPDRFSPLLLWAQFLQAGGRFLLGLIAAALAVSLGRRLSYSIRSAGTTEVDRPL